MKKENITTKNSPKNDNDVTYTSTHLVTLDNHNTSDTIVSDDAITTSHTPSNDASSLPRYASFRTRLYALFFDTFFLVIVMQTLFPAANHFSIQNIPQETHEQILLLEKERIAGRIDTTDYASTYFSLIAQHVDIKQQLFILLVQTIIVLLMILPLWQYRGATLGKMMMRIKIVDKTTLSQPKLSQWFLRLMGYILATIPCGLGFFWMALSKKKQTWQDILSNTIVIHTKPLPADWKERQFHRQTIIALILLLALIIFSQVKSQLGL